MFNALQIFRITITRAANVLKVCPETVEIATRPHVMTLQKKASWTASTLAKCQKASRPASASPVMYSLATSYTAMVRNFEKLASKQKNYKTNSSFSKFNCLCG